MHFTIGDGSITSMILAGALLRRAETLMNAEVHPSIIADGYSKAHDKAQEILLSLAQKFDIDDRESAARSADVPRDQALSRGGGIPRALGRRRDREGQGPKSHGCIHRPRPDRRHQEDRRDDLRLPADHRGRAVEGTHEVLDAVRHPRREDSVHQRAAPSAPNFPVPNLRPDIQLRQRPGDDEGVQGRGVAHAHGEDFDPVIKTGANVIVSSKTYDDHVQVALGRLGIMAIRKANEHDHKRLAKACGGNILAECANMTKDDLGYAGHISRKEPRGRQLDILRGMQGPQRRSRS